MGSFNKISDSEEEGWILTGDTSHEKISDSQDCMMLSSSDQQPVL